MAYSIKDDINEIIIRIEKENISYKDKTILVTGGAGFLGSWVCDVLVEQGAYCICLDNLSSGKLENIEHLTEKDNFRFINHDISYPIYFGMSYHPLGICMGDIKKIDIVMHMASRASPFEFQKDPISILRSNTLGTLNTLGIAKFHNALFFYTSTSEVYGNPPREAIPTRSFIYVVDEIEGFLKIVYKKDAIGEVINLGNDNEYTILKIAEVIKNLTDSNSKIVFKPLPIDDPVFRCPVLEKAKKILNWEPTTSLEEGLKKTIAWFKDNE